jgi:hypothetical protein
MNYGMDNSWARQPMFPDIPDRDQMESFDFQGAQVDTVPSAAQPGDVVLPIEVAQFHPELVAAVQKVIAQNGADPNAYVVGSPHGNYNPHTGQQHFFLKKIGKAIKKVAKPIVRIAAPVVGFAYGGPAGAAAASAAATKLTGGSTKEALLAAGGSYIGAGGFSGSATAAGGQTVGQALSTPSTGFGSSITNAAKSGANTLLNMAPEGFANTMRLATTSGVSGALQGQMLGSGIGQASDMYSAQKRAQAEALASMQNAFNNIQAGPVNLPGGVSGFNFLPQNQQANARTVDYSNQTPSGAMMGAGIQYLDRVKDRDTGSYNYQPSRDGGGSFSANVNSQYRRQGFGGALEYV